MCGLVGVLRRNRAPVATEIVAMMAQSLSHRGPDDEGAFNAPGVGLHHKRLSIIDLATGHQPMTAEGATIVFNGEIYNYLELRADLVARGHTFETSSDTEVLLRGYLEWGKDVVRRLNGMFAFLIFDGRTRKLLAARDHFGVKPLYWLESDDALLYASEIKALLGWPGVRTRVNQSALEEYVTFQHTLDDDTLFAGVRKVRPAYLQIVDVDTLHIQDECYWKPEFSYRLDSSEDSAIEELRSLLADSARLQVRSDVPLGAYLSGGLDSSTVATLATQKLGSGMPVFVGAFREGSEFDESVHARTVADRIRAQAYVLYAEESDFLELLPRLVWHMDEPAAGPGLFPQYIVSRFASEKVKVCLGGQGGDELFGGYARYLVAYFEQALRASIVGDSNEGPDALPLQDLHLGLGMLRQYRPMMQRFVADGFLSDPPERRYFRLLDRTEGTLEVFSDDFRSLYAQEAVFDRFQGRFAQAQTSSFLDQMTAFDLSCSLPALLQVEDRVSMAVSLESRVPLLDHRIANLVASLPPRLKYSGGQLKYLLKRAVAPWLPESVLRREDKMGFPVPLHRWARGRTGEFMKDVLLSRACRERGLFDQSALERLVRNERAFSRVLWGLLQLELWHQEFIDRPPFRVRPERTGSLYLAPTSLH